MPKKNEVKCVHCGKDAMPGYDFCVSCYYAEVEKANEARREKENCQHEH